MGFYGILGYSQGAAFVPVYLANAPVGSFEKAMMFCGYLTETHLGLLGQVETESPFGDISSLIWIGEQDTVIPPSMSRDLIPKFTSPTVVSSRFGGHIVLGPSDSTFDQVLAFVRGEDLPTNNDPDTSDNDDQADDVPVSDEDKSDDVQVSDEDKSGDTVEDCVDDPSFASVTRKTETAKPGLPRIRKSAASKDGGAKRSPKTAQHRVAYASQRISQKTSQKTSQTTNLKTSQKKSQRRKNASMIQTFAFATRKTETVKLGLPPIRKSAAAKSGREKRSLATVQGLVTLARSDENTKRGSFDTDCPMSNLDSNPLGNIIVCEYI